MSMKGPNGYRGIACVEDKTENRDLNKDYIN